MKAIITLRCMCVYIYMYIYIPIVYLSMCKFTYQLMSCIHISNPFLFHERNQERCFHTPSVLKPELHHFWTRPFSEFRQVSQRFMRFLVHHLSISGQFHICITMIIIIKILKSVRLPLNHHEITMNSNSIP